MEKFDRIFITGDQHGCVDNILYLDYKEKPNRK